MAHIIRGSGQVSERKAPAAPSARSSKRSKTGTVAVDLPRDITVTVSARDLAKLTSLSPAGIAKVLADAGPAQVTKAAAQPRAAKRAAKGATRVARKSKKLTCGNCRRPLKAAWMGCPHCLKPNAGYRPPATKTARPAMGKMGSATCPVGHLTRSGARYCTTCGTAMQQASLKSYEQVRRETFIPKVHASHNPAEREALWRLAHPELYPNGGAW